MPRFRYQALDASGQPVTGSVAAEDQQQAVRGAERIGLRAVRVAVPPSQPTWHERVARGYLSFLFHPVSAKDLALWYRSLHHVLKAGINPVQGSGLLASSTSNSTLRMVSREMADTAAAGRPIAPVLSEYPSVFPDFARAVMEAGQESGTLQESAQRMADYYDQLFELQQAFRSQTFYPKILLLAWLAIPIMPTLVLEGPGAYFNALLSRAWYLAVAVVCVWLGWRFLTQFAWFRRAFDRFKLSLPALGGIARRNALARWARTLATMLKAGVPLGRSIEAAGAACGNAVIEEAVMHRAQGVLHGKPLSQVLAETGEFPNSLVEMMAIGEQSGDPGQMLDRVATYYEMEARTASHQTAITVGVGFYMLMAILIGITVITFWAGYGTGVASHMP